MISRPAEIQWWTKHRRTMASFPDLNLAVFPLQVRNWWISVQPLWRTKDGSSWTLSRNIPRGEDWTVTRRGGSNGLLLFVMAAFWWAKAAREDGNKSTSKDLALFLDDLAFVFESLRAVVKCSDPIDEARAPGSVRQSSHSPSDADEITGRAVDTTKGYRQKGTASARGVLAGRKPRTGKQASLLREPSSPVSLEQKAPTGRITRSRSSKV